MKTITIAEIGINHNCDINLAKQMIDIAKYAGFTYVKFQKRNPYLAVPKDQKTKPKRVPWREEETTYLQYKLDIEWTIPQYTELVSYAHNVGIGIFSSVWDVDSVNEMKMFTTKIHPVLKNKVNLNKDYGIILKIPSPHLTNISLIKEARKHSDILMISTGMSTEKQIETAIKEGKPDVVFHTNSTYPAPVNELNLNYITHLKKKYPNIIPSYSGHEYGITTTFAAIMLGAEIIERHVTIDRTMWGSDQMASVEPIGQFKLIKGIRELELAMGNGGPRQILQSEMTKLKSLRGK